MTNPGSIVRVRSRNGGLASVYEANAWAQQFSTGLLSGVGVVQNDNPGMSVLVGGSTNEPDNLIGENPAGYKIALDLVGQELVNVTAPASNSRITAIVAYTDDLSLQSSDTETTGSPSSCGLIVVNGTSGASPSAPTDAQIRAAITADGATGSQAIYSVPATIKIDSTTDTITNELITVNKALIGAQNVDWAALPAFSVSITASQSIPSSTQTKINFDTKVHDTTNSFDLTKHVFVAPFKGIFAFTSQVTQSNDPSQNFQANIIAPNVSYRSGYASGVWGESATVSIELEAGDEVYVGAYNSGSTKPIATAPSQTYFMGWTIAKL